MKKQIIKYYNDLAFNYDEDRFLNSYGKYIHRQEKRILQEYLPSDSIKRNLDLACGTGRFLAFAHHGIDLSNQMVKVSKAKFPQKNIRVADAEKLPFKTDYFKNIFSFHLFMHLKLNDVAIILSEVHRIIEKGGYFIFDIPSQKRRKLTNYNSKDWHGGNQANLASIKKLCSKKWDLISYHGVAFFPIHRIPFKLRKHIVTLDNLLGSSFLKEYSSHLVFILKKR